MFAYIGFNTCSIFFVSERLQRVALFSFGASMPDLKICFTNTSTLEGAAVGQRYDRRTAVLEIP